MFIPDKTRQRASNEIPVRDRGRELIYLVRVLLKQIQIANRPPPFIKKYNCGVLGQG